MPAGDGEAGLLQRNLLAFSLHVGFRGLQGSKGSVHCNASTSILHMPAPQRNQELAAAAAAGRWSSLDLQPGGEHYIWVGSKRLSYDLTKASSLAPSGARLRVHYFPM